MVQPEPDQPAELVGVLPTDVRTLPGATHSYLSAACSTTGSLPRTPGTEEKVADGRQPGGAGELQCPHLDIDRRIDGGRTPAR